MPPTSISIIIWSARASLAAIYCWDGMFYLIDSGLLGCSTFELHNNQPEVCFLGPLTARDNNQVYIMDMVRGWRVELMFCCWIEYFEGNFVLVCGGSRWAKDWYLDEISSNWRHQTTTTTVGMQPAKLFGQRMECGHDMKEIWGQVLVRVKFFLSAHLSEMMSFYRRINASFCAADTPMHCPCNDEREHMLELYFGS